MDDLRRAYKILKATPETSDENLKRVHYIACSLYHPDKGGDPETFGRFQWAYKTIMKYRKTGVQFHDVASPSDFNTLRNRSRDATPVANYQFKPEQFRTGTSSGTSFDSSKFNDTFRVQSQQGEKSASGEMDFTYGVDDTVTHQRTKAQYERERDRVTAEAESVKAIFDRRNFNNDTFQKVFVHNQNKHKGNSDVTEYSEPIPLAASGLIECTSIKSSDTQGLMTAGSASFNEAYNMPKNPEHYDRNVIDSMPNITTEGSLSSKEIKDRLRDYHSAVNLDDLKSRFKKEREMFEEPSYSVPMDRPQSVGREKSRMLPSYTPISPALLSQPPRSHLPMHNMYQEMQPDPRSQMQMQMDTRSQMQKDPRSQMQTDPRSQMPSRRKTDTDTDKEIRRLKKQLEKQKMQIKKLSGQGGFLGGF